MDINSTVPMQEQYAYNCTIYSLKVYFMLNGMSDIIERVINFKDTPHEKILSGIQDDEIIEYSMNLQEDNDVSYITVCNSKSPKKMQLLNTDFKGIIGKVCKQHQN